MLGWLTFIVSVSYNVKEKLSLKVRFFVLKKKAFFEQKVKGTGRIEETDGGKSWNKRF